jgi:C-terminal processing protease CtpA/Prc
VLRPALTGFTTVFIAAAWGNASADAPLDRLLGAVEHHASVPEDLTATIVQQCGATDLACAAAIIVERLGSPVRLVEVAHPDTDSIRRARTVPSVRATERRADGTLVIMLDRFGRKADQEIADSISPGKNAAPEHLVLDLRGNTGGDFDRMRRVASLFTGAKEHAVRLIGRSGVKTVSLPEPLRTITIDALDVLIGPETASSAEVLAALLRHHAGARLIGARTHGKDHLTRLIPVNHDWRLLIPAERIEVLGETLAGGLTPDIAAEPSTP